MSDSVDRVFSHALNTVNKIRTGSQKPPSATRLKLYGLYKQAMEGDVDGIMERPQGDGDEVHRAREKWDAWKQQNGLSRTEAKRRYISTLIDTMHKYASPSPDSRELVAELEFVWDQVKSNVPSSSSSSPMQYLEYNTKGKRPVRTRKDKEEDDDDDDDYEEQTPLKVKSPMSQSEEDAQASEAELDGEDFVDAPDSQYTSPPRSRHPQTTSVMVQTDPNLLQPQEPIPFTTPQRPPARAMNLLPSLFTPAQTAARNSQIPEPESVADKKWRKRMEQALIKTTAEIAALREQLEQRSLFTHTKRFIFFRAVGRFVWGVVRHVAIDVLVLGIVLVWLRWKRKDRRLEGAVRVLLGDAVAQVQKVGGVGILGRVGKVPALVGGGGGKKGG